MDKFNNIVLLFIMILYGLMKAMGLIPYGLKVRELIATRSRVYFIYAIIFTTAFAIAFIVVGLPMLKFRFNGRPMLGLNSHMTKLHYFSKVIVSVAICLSQISNSDETIEWVANCRLVFSKLINLETSSYLQYRATIVFFVVRTLLQIIAHTATNVLRLMYLVNSKLLPNWFAVGILTLPSLMISLCANKFTVLTIISAHGLAKLNANLRNQVKILNGGGGVGNPQLSRMQKLNAHETASEKIDALTVLHAELYRTIRQMANLYSWQIFLIVAFLFLNIITELYFICDHITRRAKGLQRRPEILEVFGFINFCLFATELYFIINGCQLLKEASEETGILIHKISVFNLDERLKQSIEALSLRVRLTELIIRPMHLFELDSSTLYKMAHAITTYLIILVQFKMTEDFERTKRRIARFSGNELKSNQ